MQLKSQLTSLRFYEALAAAGVIADPGEVNRVVIVADRGGQVVLHVETLAGASVAAAARSAFDGLDLKEDP